MINYPDIIMMFASIMLGIGIVGLVLKQYGFKGFGFTFKTTAWVTATGLGLYSGCLLYLGNYLSASLSFGNMLLWTLLWFKPLE